MTGLMDYTPGDVSRPAGIPAWSEIDYSAGTTWLNSLPIGRQTHSNYRQTLDMHDGVLRTSYRWRSDGRDSDIVVTSLVSQSASHLAAVSFGLTPRFSGTVHLRFTLRAPAPPERLPLADMDAKAFTAAAAAADRPELAIGGNRSAIWYRGQVAVTTMSGDAQGGTLHLEARAVGGRSLAMAAAVAYPRGLDPAQVRVTRTADAVLLELDARVQNGRTYRFTKFVAAAAEGWDADADREAESARDSGWSAVMAAHVAAWHALWQSDVRVGGNPGLQRTLHSDLFYLLENSAQGGSWAAAACGFSGNYFGHVFWDNDFWVFPALLLLHPERARSLIEFRGRTLPQAQARALAHGFAGAMVPWEADPWSGADVTPGFAVENADREVHANGAVALAQWQYYLASGDRAWLADHGFPIIKAVADFWVSRVVYVPAKSRYELHDVTSPEEDYLHVDDEIYTNAAAQRSLEAAIAAAAALGIVPDPRWAEVAAALYLPSSGNRPAYFDFDPTTAHDKTTSWMATSVPMLSIPALGFDVGAAAAPGLFRHSVEAIAPILSHANQMVLVMLAIQAANAGDAGYFHSLVAGSVNAAFLKPPFNVRSETPQNDSLYLLATSGGFVQAFIYGLSGLRLEEAGLVGRYAPSLPEGLTYLKLTHLTVRGRTLDVTISRRPSGRVVRRISEKRA